MGSEIPLSTRHYFFSLENCCKFILTTVDDTTPGQKFDHDPSQGLFHVGCRSWTHYAGPTRLICSAETQKTPVVFSGSADPAPELTKVLNTLMASQPQLNRDAQLHVARAFELGGLAILVVGHEPRHVLLEADLPMHLTAPMILSSQRKDLRFIHHVSAVCS